MQCPKCGTTVQVGDRFCEECGTSLVADRAIPKTTGGCEKCGASPEDIDAEGYCSNCGFRNQARENDRIEVICSPKLAGISDRGLRRHRNEDYLACAQVESKNAYVLVVCDGVSSSQEPDLAAKAAAESACRALTAAVENDTESQAAIKMAVAAALSAVSAIPYTKGVNDDPPSTTIVVAVVQERTATIGWLGDSRAYWISPHGSRQLTKDDSWLNDVVASGQMSQAEARKSDNSHAITRWLGVDAIADSEPSVLNFYIPGTGYLLLCTDGLWNYTPDTAQMTELVKERSEADAALISHQLVEFARRSGGHDNITVALLSV